MLCDSRVNREMIRANLFSDCLLGDSGEQLFSAFLTFFHSNYSQLQGKESSLQSPLNSLDCHGALYVLQNSLEQKFGMSSMARNQK